MIKATPIASIVKNCLPKTNASNMNGIVTPAISPYDAIADFEILIPIIINSRATQPKKQPIIER